MAQETTSKRDASFGTDPQPDHAMAYAALASMADAVYGVDTAGRFIFANAAFEAVTGYALSDLRGTPAARLHVPEAEALFTERRRQVSSGVTVSPVVETLLRLKDERWLPVELSISDLIMAGQIAGRVVVVRDLTARRRPEEVLPASEERRRSASPSTDAAASLEALWTEIRQRMGVCPSFFKLATPEPTIARALFDLAKIAYLDSPLPAVFKEKLFTSLSRFCAVQYCVARHMAFLLGRGYIAGDSEALALPVEEVAALLDEPLPDMAELSHLLAELEVQPALEAWPAFESRLGKLVRVACAMVFLEPERSARWCQALRQLFGPKRYEQLVLFLAFVRTAHFWTEVHPELALEGDVEMLLEEHETLADSIRNSADITRRFQIDERVAAEWRELRHTAALADALRQSEARLAAILEQLPVAVGAVDPDGRITLANALWRVYIPRQLPSYDPEGAKRWRAFTADGESIAPSDWPASQALRGQSVFGMDFLHRRDDGRDVWLRISSAPFRDDGGSLIGAICVIEDIDAHKRAEQALRESEVRFRSTFENAAVGIAHVGLEGRWLRVNGRLCEITGYSHEALRMRTFQDITHPDDLEADLAYLHQVHAGEIETYTMEKRYLRKDGGIVWINLTVSLVRTSSGEPDYYIAVIEDITLRKRAEAALRDLTATLEQRVAERTADLAQAMAEQQRLEREAQRAAHFALLGRLAAGVSHELRNPLAAVFLHVDLLAEELAQPSADSPALLAEYLAELKTELARVDDLVQDYLSLVRVHAIHCEVQDLGVAVAAWCHEFQEVVAAHGVTLQADGVEKLGLVAFHASTLRRALLNLVQNAAEAMPQGGTVILAAQSTADQVQLQVRDTGSGIAPERLSQLFEPLHTTKPGGTGLGLYIVQEVATAHGGQVTVQSVEGQGTTFTLMLPLASVEKGPETYTNMRLE